MNQILEAAEAIIAQVESIELLHVDADDLEDMTTTTTEADLTLLHELIGRYRFVVDGYVRIVGGVNVDLTRAGLAEAGPLDRVRATDSEEMARIREDNFVLRARMHAIALLSSEVSP